MLCCAVLNVLQDGKNGTVLTEKEVKTCHRTLYDFLHGKIDDPIKAGE